MSDSGYLTNQLLIAMPSMGDPNFAQTVALVCEHSASGALGLILNKPLPMRMGEIFEQLEIELKLGQLRERQVLRGGPMAKILESYPALFEWRARMEKLGHGTFDKLDSGEAA